MKNTIERTGKHTMRRTSNHLAIVTVILTSIVTSRAAAQLPADQSVRQEPKVKLRVMAVPKKGETTKPKTLKVDAYWQFTYQLGSLKPSFDGKIKADAPAFYGGEGYGGGLGGGYGGEGGYGDEGAAGYGGGSYGGMGSGEGMYGGMGGGGLGESSNHKTIQLFAIAENNADPQVRPSVKIYTEFNSIYDSPDGMSGMGMGPGGGMAMGAGGMGGPGGGMSGGIGYGGGDEGMGMGAGMGMGGGMMGMGGGGSGLPLLGELQEINQQAKLTSVGLSDTELKLVTAIVSQQVWKDTLLDAIKEKSNDEQFIASAEPRLIELLKEQYTTQLQRQKMEIQKIEAKVEKLKSELARREAAAERVIQVQAGRIILQAQGLLGN